MQGFGDRLELNMRGSLGREHELPTDLDILSRVSEAVRFARCRMASEKRDGVPIRFAVHEARDGVTYCLVRPTSEPRVFPKRPVKFRRVVPNTDILFSIDRA